MHDVCMVVPAAERGLLLQPRFRSMWERYCRGVQAIVYVVDSADHDGLEQSKSELHDLLGKPSLAGVPVLVLGNKNDLDGALPQAELIEKLDLKVRGSMHGWADTCVCADVCQLCMHRH